MYNGNILGFGLKYVKVHIKKVKTRRFVAREELSLRNKKRGNQL